MKHIQHPDSPGGLALGGVGPVAEGFVGLFVGVGACLLAAFWVGDRTEHDEDDGHEGHDGHDGDDRRPRRGTAATTSASSPMPEDTDGRALPAGRRRRHRVTIPVRSVDVADAPQYQIAAKNPRRAEIVGGGGFLLGAAGFAGFGAAYWQNYSNFWLGVTFGVGFAGVGYGMVVVGQVPDAAGGRSRRPGTVLAPTEEEREAFVEDFASRGQGGRSSAAASSSRPSASRPAVLGVVLAFPLIRSLGPLPGKTLYKTRLAQGLLPRRHHRSQGQGRRPRGRRLHHRLSRGRHRRRLLPDDAHPRRPAASGYLPPPPRFASSGRPGRRRLHRLLEGLHARRVPRGPLRGAHKQMLCPCHQSLFDVTDAATPIFGPAPRPLPSSPSTSTTTGYFRAQDGYDEPVGPGFWERGND